MVPDAGLRPLALIGAVFGALLGAPAVAFTLDLPAAATQTGEDIRLEDQLLVPTGPRFGSGGPGLVAEGRITRRAWDLPATRLTPFQLLGPLSQQLEALGFEPLYACRDRACGGFDFRLSLDLLDAPAMHVDLGDFRYYAARRDSNGGPEVISLVTSRSGDGGHIHMTLVTPVDSTESLDARPVAEPGQEVPTSETLRRLEGTGHTILDGLQFRPGSADLENGTIPALTDLAAWLLADVTRSVVLVGHSDNVGGLEENIRLSERRAASVVEALVSGYSVPAAQLSARGVGYLAPIAPNDTPEGRRLNRRVEAVIGAP